MQHRICLIFSSCNTSSCSTLTILTHQTVWCGAVVLLLHWTNKRQRAIGGFHSFWLLIRTRKANYTSKKCAVPNCSFGCWLHYITVRTVHNNRTLFLFYIVSCGEIKEPPGSIIARFSRLHTFFIITHWLQMPPIMTNYEAPPSGCTHSSRYTSTWWCCGGNLRDYFLYLFLIAEKNKTFNKGIFRASLTFSC